MAANLFKMAAYSRKFIQDGGGVLTSSTRRVHKSRASAKACRTEI